MSNQLHTQTQLDGKPRAIIQLNDEEDAGASIAAVAVEPALLDAGGVGQMLGVSKRHVLRMDRSGVLGPLPIKLGRCVRWSADEIRRWAAARCPGRREWLAMERDDQ